MKCEDVRQRLSLYLYSELASEEEEAFSRHLNDCVSCRRELEREKALHSAWDEAGAPVPADLLERCRLELPRTLRRGRRDSSGLFALFRMPHTLRMWLRPVGAVALVALGFFAARQTVHEPLSGLDDSADVVATRVRYVEPTAEGKVNVFLDETRQRVLSGTLEDSFIQELLLAAVRDPLDPGIRAESVDLLKARSDSEEVRNALLFAVQNDSNAAVRLKALEAIQPYATEPRTRQVLSRVLLQDENPGVRTMAIDMLIQTRQNDVVETLQYLLETEDDAYVRTQSERALRAMNASLETF